MHRLQCLACIRDFVYTQWHKKQYCLVLLPLWEYWCNFAFKIPHCFILDCSLKGCISNAQLSFKGLGSLGAPV